MDEAIAELLSRDWDQLSDDELLESVRRIEVVAAVVPRSLPIDTRSTPW